MKLKRIEHVLFTSLCADRYLGLPGLVLGLGDIGSENLTVHGPTGMYEYVNACRHSINAIERTHTSGPLKGKKKEWISVWKFKKNNSH